MDGPRAMRIAAKPDGYLGELEGPEGGIKLFVRASGTKAHQFMLAGTPKQIINVKLSILMGDPVKLVV